MTDPTAEWPLMPDPRISDDAYYRRLSAAYSHRLRTTADALRTFIDSKRETGWVISAGENAGPALNKALPNARAILAALEQEGLT